LKEQCIIGWGRYKNGSRMQHCVVRTWHWNGII